MKNFLFVLMLLPGVAVFSQSIQVVDFEQLQSRLELRNDTTYVVNFWATWCLPCIKEMPAFQKIHEEYISQKVKVLLVSLDFVKHIDSRLIPFIEKHELTPEVIVLNDPDANAWIDKVSPRWSGALPATLIFNKNFREFFEQEFTYLSLKQIVESNLVKQ